MTITQMSFDVSLDYRKVGDGLPTQTIRLDLFKFVSGIFKKQSKKAQDWILDNVSIQTESNVIIFVLDPGVIDNTTCFSFALENGKRGLDVLITPNGWKVIAVVGNFVFKVETRTNEVFEMMYRFKLLNGPLLNHTMKGSWTDSPLTAFESLNFDGEFRNSSLILGVHDEVTQKMLRLGWSRLKRSLNKKQLIHAQFYEEGVYSYLYSKTLIQFKKNWKTNLLTPQETFAFFKFADENCLDIGAFYGLLYMIEASQGVKLHYCIEFVRFVEYWAMSIYQCIQSNGDIQAFARTPNDFFNSSAIHFVLWRLIYVFPDSSMLMGLTFQSFRIQVIGLPTFNKLATLFDVIDSSLAFVNVE